MSRRAVLLPWAVAGTVLKIVLFIFSPCFSILGSISGETKKIRRNFGFLPDPASAEGGGGWHRFENSSFNFCYAIQFGQYMQKLNF